MALVYDVMYQIVTAPSVLEDVHAVDKQGNPVLPKLPVFVVGNEPEEWACRWFHIDPWSPVLSQNPVERELMMTKCIVWTKEDVFGVG
jgi:hypothetical protein